MKTKNKYFFFEELSLNFTYFIRIKHIFYPLKTTQQKYDFVMHLDIKHNIYNCIFILFFL